MVEWELGVIISTASSSALTMFSAAGALVLLLYLLLLHEVLTHLWCTEQSNSHHKGSSGGGGGGGIYRPRAHAQQKRHPHTLDALWRRMKQATDSFKMDGLKHALITTTMAEARAEARRVEQERLASTLAKD